MSQMESFITSVLGDLEGNAVMGRATGRTDSGKLEIKESVWFRYPEELPKMVEYAEKKQGGDKRNVYLAPDIYGDKRNARNEITRTKDNAVATYTIHLDSDSCPPEAYRIEPTIHVQTSRRHGHDYWVLDEPITSQESSEIAHRMVIAHKDQGADPVAWSANKFLRMPTVNTTYDVENPFKIEWFNNGVIYNVIDLAGAYDDIDLPKEALAKVTPLRPAPEVPGLENLPDYLDLLGKIPAHEKRLNDLILKEPKLGPEGWRSEQRWALILDLLRYGFNFEETISIAWHCPAARNWHDDSRSIEGLAWEVNKAQLELELERGQEPDPEPSAPAASTNAEQPLSLLSIEERRWLKDERWDWQNEYMEWARTKVQVLNRPLHAANAWMILAAAFGKIGYLPKPGAGTKVRCNFFQIHIGNSSSGKTEAAELMWSVVDYMQYESPRIGHNFSDNALAERLLDRNGMVSIFETDEADGMFEQWASGGWTSGVKQSLTKGYDGTVAQLGRVGKKELQIVGARVILNQHLMGTPEGMFNTLSVGMFRDGYLARQIWVVGEDHPVTQESIKTRQVFGDPERAYEAMPKYWATRFARKRRELSENLPIGRNELPLWFTNEAEERFDKIKWEIIQHFDTVEGDRDIWRTVTRRMSDIIWKACGLLAMSEGSNWITTQHLVVVAAHAEQWVAHVKYVVSQLASSQFSKACDAIEKLIATKEKVSAADIYTFRKGERIEAVDGYIKSLIAQHRIMEPPGRQAGGTVYYKLREAK